MGGYHLRHRAAGGASLERSARVWVRSANATAGVRRLPRTCGGGVRSALQLSHSPCSATLTTIHSTHRHGDMRKQKRPKKTKGHGSRKTKIEIGEAEAPIPGVREVSFYPLVWVYSDEDPPPLLPRVPKGLGRDGSPAPTRKRKQTYEVRYLKN